MDGCPRTISIDTRNKKGFARRRIAGCGRLILAACLLWALDPAPVDAVMTEIQGQWAFSHRGDRQSAEDLATTPSAEDAETWFLVACSAEDSLVVSLMHAGPAPFPFDLPPQVNVHSERLSGLAVPALKLDTQQIVMDPSVMMRLLPLLLEEKTIGVTLSDRSGRPHEYTFVMQPNDIALAPIRSRCLGRGRGT